jgi:mRNA-degrading endonuclease RelE of RelBE toxin-antitoxin system
VRWNPISRELWRQIGDPRLQRKLALAAETLSEEPHLRGQPLYDDLDGYRSLHWARYRIVYLIDDESRVVHIISLGLRARGKSKDVYAVTKKLLQLGLLEEPPDQSSP